MADELYRLPPGGRIRAAGVYPAVLAGTVSGLLLTLWVATEWLAYQWHFSPSLGRPWLTLGGWAVYPPWSCLIWWVRFHSLSGAEAPWGGMWRILLSGSVLALGSTVWVALRRARHVGGQSDLYGSARWATWDDLTRARLLSGDGVYVGAWKECGTTWYLRHTGPQPVLGFAPTRSGKGVGLVVPTLLAWPHSVVCNDPKAGENWRLTAGWRKRQGGICLRFDPTCQDGSAACYNPLLEVRPWPLDVRDAQTIAEAVIERTEHKGDGDWQHWQNTAEDLLVGVILHVLYAGQDKTLRGCLTLLTDPARPLAETLAAMRTTIHDPEGQYNWMDTNTGKPIRTHPIIAGAAKALENKSPNEQSSVVSSAVAYLKLYRDPIVTRNIEACDFAISDLFQTRLAGDNSETSSRRTKGKARESEQSVSLYLTTPTSDLQRTKPLTRILLNQIVHRLTEQLPDLVERDEQRVLLMLDEFPLLGEMRFFHTALAVLASYGIKVYLIAQDLSQIALAYGKEEAITSNCHVQVAFAANRLETAEWISKRTGVRTVHKEQRTYTGSRFALWLPHVIASESESQRALLTPDEVMRLPEDDAVVFVAGFPAILGKKIRYYQDAEFSRRAAIPAPEESDRIPHDWSFWLKKSGGSAPTGSAKGDLF
jgi:type IV secretion system protein VirD4